MVVILAKESPHTVKLSTHRISLLHCCSNHVAPPFYVHFEFGQWFSILNDYVEPEPLQITLHYASAIVIP